MRVADTTDYREQWLGTVKDGWLIKDLIAEGPYSWVYRAVKGQGEAPKVIKVAKPFALSGTIPHGAGNLSDGLAFITGGTTPVRPDPYSLLVLQHQKLSWTMDPALVRAEPVLHDDALASMHMEYVDGQTLRQAMSSGPVAVALLMDLALGLERLSAISDFQVHGDLKPENIMVGAGRKIKLLDPGYFGPIDCREGNFTRVAVTTPAYYPELLPDDLLAMGIMLWEIATKRHPLDGMRSLADIDGSLADDDLVAWAKDAQVVGHYYLLPLLQIREPSQIRPELPSLCTEVLLKGLRLKVKENGRLGRGDGFASFTEMADALKGLIDQGVYEL